MKISIIGAGNGGQAMAGHFALLGHEMSLYNMSLNAIQLLADSKKIVLKGAIAGEGKIKIITESLEEAVRDAELIMLVTTADAHRELAEKMAPYLQENQIIVLNPGRTLGALDFSNALKKVSKKKIYIAEAQTLIYACRAESIGNVRIIGVKDKVLLSAYPSSDTDHVISVLNSVFSCFIKAKNILKTSLENIGAILHPSIVMFNAAAIERGNQFYFYNDITTAIAYFIEEIDKERLNVGKAFGVNLLSVAEWVSFAYKDIVGDTLCEKLKNNPAYYKILAPDNLHSRLLLEDIPTGLIPFMELATLSDVKTPLMNAIVNISQTLLNKNFYEEGRTLKNLGLNHLNIKEFKKSL